MSLTRSGLVDDASHPTCMSRQIRAPMCVSAAIVGVAVANRSHLAEAPAVTLSDPHARVSCCSSHPHGVPHCRTLTVLLAGNQAQCAGLASSPLSLGPASSTRNFAPPVRVRYWARVTARASPHCHAGQGRLRCSCTRHDHVPQSHNAEARAEVRATRPSVSTMVSRSHS